MLRINAWISNVFSVFPTFKKNYAQRLNQRIFQPSLPIYTSNKIQQKMMLKLHLTAVLALLLLAHSCESIFFPAAVGTGATAIATTISPNLLSLAAAEQYYYHQNDYHHYHRRRRDASEEEQKSLLKVIRELEPEDCMKKMICSLAVMDLKDNPILFFFPFDAQSAENNLKSENDLAFEYRVAAKIGKSLKSVNNCDSFYKCSISSEQLLKLASI
ncbi:unnamed protein product [Lepeophtheirus salmonis]|uniref:(salmon louse) hypothetical protein n=1 Tax=Lepeophtheirus salmonis TaxID=72036 RepID=A0A7R8CHL8_LEPSM|nr:unnamed protein product [Lepeophtheirus salmonis]CAF2825302.1 unnamed protein product [Lepeophtheirus salmonis]